MQENLVLGLYLLLLLLSGGLLVLFFRRLSQQASRNPQRVLRFTQLALGNLLVLATLLCLGLLAGEVYYRFIYDATDSLDYTKVSVRWFARHYHMNSWGCRDTINYANEIAPGRRRVTYVGDSFSAGQGIKDVNDLFAFRLCRDHPEWETHLVARPALDTGHELDSMASMLTNHYQADLVVLVYCLNDIGDLLPEASAAAQRVYDDADHCNWFRRNSYFVNTLYNRLSLLWNSDLKAYNHLLIDSYRGPAWQKQRERLRAFRDLVQSHGGRFVVVTFPFFDTLGPDYPWQFVHDQLGQCWRELGVPHLDLLPVYHGLPPRKLMVNRSDSHPNEYAHALAAQAMGPFLKQQMDAAPRR